MEKVDNRKLGSHLKRLREERKLTLGGVENLSEGLGERIAKTYLFRVERGKTVPTIPRLRILAKVYRIKFSMMVDVLEGAYEESEREVDLGVEVKDLSFEDLRTLGVEAERHGDFARAALFYRAAGNKALSGAPSPERSQRLASTKHDLAIALQRSGRLELARDEAEAALEMDDVSTQLLDKIRLTLAVTYRQMSRCVLSHDILVSLLARKETLQEEVLAATFVEMGSVLLRKHPRDAAIHYRTALSLVRRSRTPYQECVLLYNIALAETGAKNLERTLKALHRAQGIARKRDFNFWIAKIQTEIGKVLYLKGSLREARSTLHEANDLARRRDYYEQLFLNQFYLRRIAVDEGDLAGAKAMTASMRFFVTRIEETFEELDGFKRELEASREERP